MLRRAALLTVAVCVPVLLQAQRVRFGLAAGTSLVGGGGSRALVDAGGFNVTGADQAGFHVRGMAEVPLGSAAFAFRAELFYNSLHSRPNSVAIVGSGSGAAVISWRRPARSPGRRSCPRHLSTCRPVSRPTARSSYSKATRSPMGDAIAARPKRT